jgi:hypothetical protein
LQKTSKSFIELNKSKVTTIFEFIEANWGKKSFEHLSDKRLLAIAYKTWSEAIKDLTDEQISYAFKRLSIFCQYPPTISEFRKCALKIVPCDQAFSEAITYHQCLMNGLSDFTGCSNKAVVQAYREITTWAWNNLDRYECRKLFKGFYELFTEKLLMGDENK